MTNEKEKNEICSENSNDENANKTAESIIESQSEPASDQINAPEAAAELPDPEKEAEIAKIKAEAIAEWEAKKAAEAEELKNKKDCAGKTLRKTFSSCGWSVLTLMGIWIGILFACSVFVEILDVSGLSELFFGGAVFDIYMKYYLVFNEVALLIAVFIASLLLKTRESAKPEKRPVSFSKFLILIPICFAIRTAGTLISNVFTIFSAFFGSETTDELTALLSETNPWLALIFTGIVAPIIEEIFFRKMLIDRLRPHGEMACIVVSSLFFGLFHQNIGQFFYAFGIGLVLAHLYYHSGRCSLSIILHAIFNIIGTIPLFFYEEILAIEEICYRIIDEGESIMALAEFALPIIIYLVYALILFALSISGIIIICMNYKKIKISKTDSVLTPAEQRAVFWKTPGIITAVAVMGVLTLASLF